ncbi:uncharacterized protein LOC129751460 [Uranotaenia lowii]|uniref:uncharacterized protein LOC129751460 n=1 Tax=Uranotaenia lowii TaxID=190385 RepID=UPI00247AA2C8|nr:uncharacterized protein LOC129751460 [Uranotaenia lowii]
MQKLFTRYIHFEVTAFGVLILMRSIIMVHKVLTDPDLDAMMNYFWEFTSDFRWLREVIVPCELLYVTAVLLLFYGIRSKDERFFFALMVAVFVDFGVKVFGQINAIWMSESEKLWTWPIFLDPMQLVSQVYELIHWSLTIILLSRIYSTGRNARNQFVRFRVKEDEMKLID